MLFFYYIFLLILFMGVIVGATIAFTQSLYIIRTPLLDSMRLYDPSAKAEKYVETTQGWDDVQKAVSFEFI